VKITDLEISGFGVWNGLQLSDLSDRLHVFYGANEAGKTTLMQFSRGVLYGFSQPRRRRYLPPVHGGMPGGSIQVTDESGSYRIERHLDPANLDGPERLTLTADDGTRRAGHVLDSLLCNVDEAIFNNVFAVGLREIQQLDSLDSTEAARLLYDLTTGVDRVSLVEVMRQLESTRSKLLARDESRSVVTGLLARRAELEVQIEQQQGQTRNFVRLVAERNTLKDTIERQQSEIDRVEGRLRLVDVAVSVGEKWRQRDNLDRQLEALGLVDEVSPEAIRRLEELSSQIERHQSRRTLLRDKRRELRSAIDRLPIKDALRRHAARIEVLTEQQPWIASIQRQLGRLSSEVEQLEQRFDADFGQLGRHFESGQPLPEISQQVIADLRPTARAMKTTRAAYQQAGRDVEQQQDAFEEAAERIDSALLTHNETDLNVALETTGNHVAELRRRMQLEERSKQLQHQEGELQQRGDDLFGHQVLSTRMVVGLGAIFVLGVVMVLAGIVGMIVPSLGLGGGLLGTFLGLLMCGSAVGGKVFLEHAASARLKDCHRQSEMLRTQIEQIESERKQLGAGTPAATLAEAEVQLQQVQQLVPLQSGRHAAESELATAKQQQQQAERRLTAAQDAWRRALENHHLPSELAPKHVRELASRGRQTRQLSEQLAERRAELVETRRQYESITGRLHQIAVQADIEPVGVEPDKLIEQLQIALLDHQAHVERRRDLSRKARRLQREQVRCAGRVHKLGVKRRRLLEHLGISDEDEMRRRAVEYSRAALLTEERAAMEREISVMIAGRCSEQELVEFVTPENIADLAHQANSLEAARNGAKEALEKAHERRGELKQQIETLAESRQLETTRLELEDVNTRLDGALSQWQVRAVIGRLLESIRTQYEQERQPETLQEASIYLNQLTEGRYCRVWTPLDEDVLLVDDGQGETLSAEVLSRGTREQLFLALRLSLAASYARRGANLPLILDDVLVNYDVGRAKAAAKVLRDFAKSGHQVLVFTCHEHLYKMFKSMRVKAEELPRRETSAGAVVALVKAKPKPSRRKKEKPPEPDVPAEELEEIELTDDDMIDEEEVVAEELEDDEEYEYEYEEEEDDDEEEYEDDDAEAA
jgi:uncharacterized protein YhaN